MKKKYKVNIYYPLAIALITVLLLTGFSLFYHFPGVGDAIKIQPDEPLDLTVQGEFSIDVDRVNSFEIDVETSQEGLETYEVSVIVQDDLAKYTLADRGKVIATGFLGGQVAHSEGIYIDDDDIADLKFSYNEINHVFAVSAPLFVGASASNIELYDQDGDLITKPQTVLVGEQYTYTLRVSSDYLPNVQVSLDDLTLVTEETISGTTKDIELTFSPAEVKPYVLTVSSDVGGEITTKDYVLGGDGLIYHLQDEDYPETKLFLLDDNTAKAELTFSKQGKQPFSLPCTGSVLIEEVRPDARYNDTPPTQLISELDQAGLVRIYGFDVADNIPAAYQKDVPSDFYYLDSLQGYMLEIDTPVKIETACSVANELPALQRGWNLVGSTGYMAGSKTNLATPPGLDVKEVYLMKLGENPIPYDGDAIEPGKVYWILVN
jgi:hypothetical protein